MNVPLHGQRPPARGFWSRLDRRAKFAIIGGSALAILILLCAGLGMAAGNSAKTDLSANKAPAASAPKSASGKASAPAATPSSHLAAPVALTSVTLKGSGVTIKKLKPGGYMTGTYQVDYSFGSWCGQAGFLKANGENGAEFMEDINDCAGDTDGKLAGSTVVHLDKVTMVKTGNTRGAWEITFTRIA